MKVHGSFVILDINNKRCTDARNFFKVDIGKTSSPHDCSGPPLAQVLYYELWIGAYFPYLMCNILTR